MSIRGEGTRRSGARWGSTGRRGKPAGGDELGEWIAASAFVSRIPCRPTVPTWLGHSRAVFGRRGPLSASCSSPRSRRG